MNQFDVVVIGGGIVGLASAWQVLKKRNGLRVIVLEKEREVALHQTGRNSGVIHSGIYYKPGSLKAINCREGKEALQRFCDEHGIPYEICGKVIVAVDESQTARLAALEQRGRENGVTCRRISIDELKEIEPHVKGVAALHVPETGIVNYGQVARKLAQLICNAGGQVRTASRVEDIRLGETTIEIVTATETFPATLAVNCAGLHSDRIGAMLGATRRARIVPFRGEYFTVRPDRGYLCKNLIYPVPDPRFPFLGVHFTRMMDGSIHCGPNAVLAMAREGYQKTNFSFRDLKDSLFYGGFLRLAGKHLKTGIGEMYRSLSKGAFVRALQGLIPEIRAEDLTPSPAGIRAQALMPDGSLVDDFLIDELDRAISVVNAPSPAATASLKIGSQIADRVIARL
jgi:(S)-2-hydroxyglutarate dehydrogenase